MNYSIKKFKRDNIQATNLCKLWWGQKVGAVLGDAVMTDMGFMIMDEQGVPMVAGFLYPIQGCDSALIGFPIANPDISKEERETAIHVLTTAIELEAKKLNYRFLVSYAGSKGAEAMFTREGYKVYDTNVTNFGKVL